jgi:hypothetical protein
MDLIRGLLLSAETMDRSTLASYSAEQLAYHAQLLIDANFVKGWTKRTLAQAVPTTYGIERLTWEGHEFLDAMRNATLWQRAKEEFMREGTSWTARTVFEWLESQIR